MVEWTIEQNERVKYERRRTREKEKIKQKTEIPLAINEKRNGKSNLNLSLHWKNHNEANKSIEFTKQPQPHLEYEQKISAHTKKKTYTVREWESERDTYMHIGFT